MKAVSLMANVEVFCRQRNRQTGQKLYAPILSIEKERLLLNYAYTAMLVEDYFAVALKWICIAKDLQRP